MSVRRLLWAEPDRAAAGGFAVVSAAALVVAWYQVAHTVYPTEQVAVMSASGCLAVASAGLAAYCLVLADLSDQARLLGAGRGSSRQALRLGVVGAPLGVILGGIGWYRAAHTAEFGVALTGAFLSALAVALLLGACAVHLRLVRNAINRERAVVVEQALGGPVGPVSTERGLDDGVRVAVAGLQLFHRPGCPAVAGRLAAAVTNGAAAQLQPCGLCEAAR